MKRRDWLMVSGGALLSGCAGIGGGAARSWNGDLLERADAVARANGARGWAAWQGSGLVKSWRTEERAGVLSITKALAGLGCARALGEGWLRVDEPVAGTITEWRGDSGKEEVMVRHLLQMTAGLDGGAGQLYRRTIADKGKVAISLRQVDAPESVFRYGPACWEVLAEMMQRKLSSRGESLEGFLHRAVMRPIGLHSPDWRSDAKGRFYLSTGAELSVTDLGRLGRTIAALAAGNDRAGIAAGHFREVTRSSSVNPMFGGGVWRNTGRGRAVEVEEVIDPPKGRGFWSGACVSREQPASMLVLIGSAGQRVFVWPTENRVIARLGYSASWRDAALLRIV